MTPNQRLIEIRSVLKYSKPLKASEIAQKLTEKSGTKVMRKDVNSVLYGEQPKDLKVNSRYEWSIDYSTTPKRSSAGVQRRKEHIEAAKRFTVMVGGTDKDVKEYFFNLPSVELEQFLQVYELTYGKVKAEYARSAYWGWANGKRQMSGEVAERLFKMLPPFMPTKAKLGLVETLWQHSSPKSNGEIKFNGNSNLETVTTQVSDYFRSKCDHTNHTISSDFTSRFQWLAGSDSRVKQQLLQYLRELETQLVEKHLRSKLKVIQESLNRETGEFVSGSHTVNIGNHTLAITFCEVKSSNDRLLLYLAISAAIIFILILIGKG